MWLKEIGVEVVVGLIGTIEIDACRRIGERGHVREVLLGIDPGHQGDMIADAAVDPLQTDIEGEWMIEDVGWTIEDVGWTIEDVGWTIEDVGWTIEDVGWTIEDVGWTIEDVGWTIEDVGWTIEDVGWTIEDVGWTIEDVGWTIEDVGWTIGWIEEIGDIGHNNVRTTVDLHIFFGGCGGATLCRLQCIDKLVYRYLQVYR